MSERSYHGSLSRSTKQMDDVSKGRLYHNHVQDSLFNMLELNPLFRLLEHPSRLYQQNACHCYPVTITGSFFFYLLIHLICLSRE